MILQLAFHIIMLITWPVFSSTSAQDYTIIAQPGCDSRCGAVDIPYPFGMKDPKCYAHKWFAIECRNTSTSDQGDHKPYLESLNLEVRNIDENSGTVEIMNPIFRWNCHNKTVQPVIDLRGSPFVHSQDDDKFVAVGCNKLAFLRSNRSAVGGCVSICDDNEEGNDINLGTDGCHGRYCCETSLPMYLSEYNATISNLSESLSGDECSYALIVSDDWLQ